MLAAIAAAAYWLGRDYVRRHPQDFPWTALDLRHPTGQFTAAKIAALGDEPARCRSLLAAAGGEDEPVPPRRSGPECGFEDGLRLGGRAFGYRPAGLVTACPVAAALHLLESRVIQPAAQRHLKSQVIQVLHAGSYSCRRLYGRSEGAYSEHATADAVDILGFRLEGGRQVSVLNDWDEGSAEAAFLRDVRDGACELFTTVLSPDYNEAHRDHLHLDMADRGNAGWTVCR